MTGDETNNKFCADGEHMWREEGGPVKKRYQVYLFPSLGGIPWQTDFYPVAVLYAVCRSISSGYAEIRVIDSKTGEHPLVW